MLEQHYCILRGTGGLPAFCWISTLRTPAIDMEEALGITLLTNIAAFQAQRMLNQGTGELSSVYSRLSSGLRINSAADDAAGLAVADSLRADQYISNAAIRNANDALSLLGITDGALSQISNVLFRMAELAEASANGMNNFRTRAPLQLEFSALSSEITRIARTTQFNNIALLSQTAAGNSTFRFQVGLNSLDSSQLIYSRVSGTLQALQLGDENDNMQYSINAATESDGRIAALTSLDAVKQAISTVASFRGAVGATESRLAVAVNNLQTQRESLHAAESQIRDADIASEAANLVRKRIIVEAASAVLAQANQQPNIAIKLLNH